MEKDEAHQFTTVCRFVVNDGNEDCLALFLGRRIPTCYSQNGISYDACIHLADIGLFEFAWPNLGDFTQVYDTQDIELSYFGESRKFRAMNIDPRTGQSCINYGNVGITKMGKELVKVAALGTEAVPEFFDFLESQLAQQGVIRFVPRSPDK